VEDDVDAVHGGRERRLVADVAVDPLDRPREAILVRGNRVIEDANAVVGHEGSDEVVADEAGSTRDQDRPIFERHRNMRVGV
jgi:hypothetical protein